MSCRLDDAVVKELHEFASKRRIRVSELLRRFIDDGLRAERGRDRPKVDFMTALREAQHQETLRKAAEVYEVIDK